METTTEPSESCPTKDVIRALLVNLVDPLLQSESSTSDVPSKALRESVAKQVFAVVLLYNYYHRKEIHHLEYLSFNSFLSLATEMRPALLLHLNEAGQDGDSEQTSVLEKAIVDACNFSVSLDRSSDLSTFPIKKVAVMLVDSKKENCYLHSITEDVWSLVEKTIEEDTYSGRDAVKAIKDATGFLDKHIKILERRYFVSSWSEEKTQTRFFIMMYTSEEKPGKDNSLEKHSVAELLNYMQGPPSGWTGNSIMKYFHVLPYASLIKDWFSRQKDTCVIDKESKAVCDDDMCPCTVVIRALLEGFVDPLIPVPSANSKAKFEVPSMALCESVKKQVQAVVLLYNNFVTKEKPHLESLNYEKFCSLATEVRPDMLQYLNEAEPDVDSEQTLPLEKVIVDSCPLDRSSDLSTLPVRKVSVMLVESEEKNCHLQHSSITQGVYSLIEKTVAEVQNEVIYQKVAYEAIAEATGVNRKNIEILESHLVCSLSEEKTATRFYIMKCTSQEVLSGECPVKKLLKCMEGPLFEKAPRLVVNPKAYYFHVLPYATHIKDWFSRAGDTAKSGSSTSEEPPAANLQEFLTDLYNAWDIESLSISKQDLKQDPFEQIIRFLHSRGYTGKLTFEAVVSRFPENSEVRIALETRGVRFYSVFSEKNQAADEEIKRRIAKWAFRCSSKGLLVLMACDGGYGSTIKFLRKAHPNIQSILIYRESNLINLDTYPIVGRVTMESVLAGRGIVPEAVHGIVPEAAPEAPPPEAIHGEVVVSGIDNIVWCDGAKKTCTRFKRVAKLVDK